MILGFQPSDEGSIPSYCTFTHIYTERCYVVVDFVNIRLLKTIQSSGARHEKGACVKANISVGGHAMLVMQPYIIVAPEDYEVVISKDVFDRLLAQ